MHDAIRSGTFMSLKLTWTWPYLRYPALKLEGSLHSPSPVTCLLTLDANLEPVIPFSSYAALAGLQQDCKRDCFQGELSAWTLGWAGTGAIG